jgi:hypothetical protein
MQAELGMKRTHRSLRRRRSGSARTRSFLLSHTLTTCVYASSTAAHRIGLASSVIECRSAPVLRDPV